VSFSDQDVSASNVNSVAISLEPLAYVAADRTSRTRSFTTGEVLGEVITSSIVSRNLRDVDWEMNAVLEFLSMIAQS
jgi:hypothetical protein